MRIDCTNMNKICNTKTNKNRKQKSKINTRQQYNTWKIIGSKTTKCKTKTKSNKLKQNCTTITKKQKKKKKTMTTTT